MNTELRDTQAAIEKLQNNAKARVFVYVFATLGLAMLLGRMDGMPSAPLLRQWITLDGLQGQVGERVGTVLTVPVGAVIVVFIRLTLGLRMLGPFRPILIAIALDLTGLSTGILFLVLVLSIIVYLHPKLQGGWLPYYGRLSVLLTIVVLCEAVALIIAHNFQIDVLLGAVYFPIVVLCLTADGFARVLAQEGRPPALWRGGITVVTALVIYSIATRPAYENLTKSCPEVLLLELAAVVWISNFLDYRLFQRFNIEAPAKATPPIQVAAVTSE